MPWGKGQRGGVSAGGVLVCRDKAFFLFHLTDSLSLPPEVRRPLVYAQTFLKLLYALLLKVRGDKLFFMMMTIKLKALT